MRLEARASTGGPTRPLIAGGPGWRDRWHAVRDGLLASRRFQRWAAGFPLTRRIARRRAGDLFDLCAGFVYSQVLFACVRLRLFDILRDGPQTGEALAVAVSEPPLDRRDACSAAAASLRLVERRGGARFGLGVLGAAMLGNPGIGAMVEHHALLYADLADPVALLRGEKHATAIGALLALRRQRYAGRCSAADVAAYSALMSASQALVADDVLEAYPLARHRCLLDVGGGEGTFLAAVAARAPELRLMLFDLPAVAARATRAVRHRWALRNAPRPSAAIFTGDPLPAGADIACLVRVLHDHDDGTAIDILRAVHAALPPGGTLLVAEPMAARPRAEPVGDAYFGFYLLAMGRGRPRRAAEIAEMLRDGGVRATLSAGRPVSRC